MREVNSAKKKGNSNRSRYFYLFGGVLWLTACFANTRGVKLAGFANPGVSGVKNSPKISAGCSIYIILMNALCIILEQVGGGTRFMHIELSIVSLSFFILCCSAVVG